MEFVKINVKKNCVKMESMLNTPNNGGGHQHENSNPSEVTVHSRTDALAVNSNNNNNNNNNEIEECRKTYCPKNYGIGGEKLSNKLKNSDKNSTTCQHLHQPHLHLHHIHRCSTTTSAIVRRVYAALLLISLCSSVYGCGPGRGIGGSRRNRKLTPLVFKQHVPNMSEKTLGASGLNEGVIRRDSPNFKNLVPNYNKDIIFKDEEGTGADRLMSRRCKEKLNILAVSVMNQWPGVRLRVTESWDEDNLHGADSLHYEGRAVDITTSDRDRTKYGMLARLAVEAGFDWVYYESRAHIHCSVKSDSTQTLHMNGCFTRDSTVLTSAGERKSMDDLLVGDSVLSMNEQGEPIYSEVILFMDRNLEQKQEFVQISTEGDAILTVTPAHLVMIWRSERKSTDYVFAAQVEEGDYVFVHDTSQSMSVLRPQLVIKLSAVLGQGVVAPLTREGTIVVDTVAASCYAIVDSQKLAHWSMAPMRLLAAMESWWTPESNEISSIQHQHQHHRGGTMQKGVHWYAKTLNVFKDYIVPKSWQYQL